MNSTLILHDVETAPSSGLETRYDFDNQWYGPVGQTIHDQTGAHVSMPELPNPEDACFADYSRIIDECDINDDSILIGHGFGAGVLLKYLSERKDIEPRRVALVAPWYLRTGQKGRNFFYEAPDASLPERVGKLSLLYSHDTSVNGHRSARRIEHLCSGIQVRRLRGFGKCIVGNSMKNPRFPELLQAVGIPSSESAQ